jgi:hypothetical protein
MKLSLILFHSLPIELGDPITPYRSAQLVAKLLGSKARLVQQAAYGHTSRE